MRFCSVYGAAIALVFTLAASASGQFAVYDNFTGEVKIMDAPAFYIGVQVESQVYDLIPGNANPGPQGTILDPSLAPENLFWLNFGGLPSPTFELGAILPAGLAQGWFDGVDGLAVALVPNFGSQPPSIQIPVQSFVAAWPEPSTLTMACLGLLGLASRRRSVGS